MSGLQARSSYLLKNWYIWFYVIIQTTHSNTSLTGNMTKKHGGITDPVSTPNKGTPSPTTEQSVFTKGDKEFHDGGHSGLPIWLIAVIAGGAVIATLSITATLWICWKMKRRCDSPFFFLISIIVAKMLVLLVSEVIA